MVWHREQRIETGSRGEAILELPAESLREARRFILAYGRHATALSPPELVAEMRDEANALANLYGAAAAEPKGEEIRNKGARRRRSRP